jgi:hypothetical protein
LSNAWFYFLATFSIPAIFLVAGILVFRRLREAARKDGSNDVPAVCWIVVVVSGLCSSGGFVFALGSPTPWERARLIEHVLQTSPQKIERITIRPCGSDSKSLVAAPMTVVDPAIVRRISESLATTTEVSRNHPKSRWYAEIELVTSDGTFQCQITATEPGDRHGTLVNIQMQKKSAKYNLGDWRADGLDQILEAVISPMSK